jgi:hypothetical protein
MGAGMIERSYTPEQVERGLMALVVLGSSTRAHEALKEEFGLVIPAVTLRSWRKVHHDRYFEILRKHGPELEQKAVDTKRALLPLVAEGIALGVEKTIEELEAGEAKDPSASARNLAVISGIETRDLLTLTGRPTEIRRTLGLDDLYRKLRETLGDEEIPDAEVVEEDSAEGPGLLAI